MGRQAGKWLRLAGFAGLNGLALAVVVVAVAEPFVSMLREQRERIEFSVVRLARAEAATARHEAVAALDPDLVERAEARFLQGDASSLLHADLLTRLRQAAESEGVGLTSVTSLPDRLWLGRKVVGARIELTGATGKVAAIMARIEDGRSLLFILRAKLSPAAETGTRDEVTASLDVFGVTRWPGT
jgi:Type II secretion system (T2SS), protein M subtype b